MVKSKQTCIYAQRIGNKFLKPQTNNNFFLVFGEGKIRIKSKKERWKTTQPVFNKFKDLNTKKRT